MNSLNGNHMMCACTVYNIRTNQKHTEQVCVGLQTDHNVAAGCIHLSNARFSLLQYPTTLVMLATHHFPASAAAAVTLTTHASFSCVVFRSYRTDGCQTAAYMLSARRSSGNKQNKNDKGLLLIVMAVCFLSKAVINKMSSCLGIFTLINHNTRFKS